MEVTWLILLIGPAIYAWLEVEARTQPAAKIGAAVFYRIGRSIRVLWLFGTVVISLVVVLMAAQSEERLLWVGLFGLILLLVLRPRSIRVTQHDISRPTMHGFGRKTIPWTDVEFALSRPFSGEIIVYSTSGETITHTKFHVDRSQFVRELERHTEVRRADQKII